MKNKTRIAKVVKDKDGKLWEVFASDKYCWRVFDPDTPEVVKRFDRNEVEFVPIRIKAK